MLRDIVYESSSLRQDRDVAGDTEGVIRLMSAALQRRADVVIPTVFTDHHANHPGLLISCPKLKVLAIDSDGRQLVLHELRHELRRFETQFGDMSSPRPIGAVPISMQAGWSGSSPCRRLCVTDVVR